ncbi:MAG: ATP-binding protein [Planctomycetota bacterium]
MKSLTEATSFSQWNDANLEHLSDAVDALANHLGSNDPGFGSSRREPAGGAREQLRALSQLGYPPPALVYITSTLQLSAFEADLLLLCTAWELDAARIRDLVARRHGETKALTFGLAMSLLPNAYWSACVSDQKLRRLGLLDTEPGRPLPTTTVAIADHTLDLLKGVSRPHPRIAARTIPIATTAPLTEGQRAGLEEAERHWSDEPGSSGPDVSTVALLQIHGQRQDVHAVVARLGERRGAPARAIRAADLHTDSDANDTLLRAIECDVRLRLLTLAIEADTSLLEQDEAGVRRLAGLVREGIALCPLERVATDITNTHAVRIHAPTFDERRRAWQANDFGLPADAASLLARQYRMPPQTIHRIATRTTLAGSPEERFTTLWRACRDATAPALSDLAAPVDTGFEWRDLLLPDRHASALRTLLAQARHRRAERADGAGGLVALFSGASGTGKTMAGGILGKELDLPVYRVDLSSVVSKYIGETEKHLRRVFDAAEAGGAVLLFDEADALFGKRSAVTSSHDRHANIEVSYLLQRLEAYSGIAILTTNHEDDLDEAFKRRIRSIVRFPRPGKPLRRELWRRGLQGRLAPQPVELLAEIPLTGANIRNILDVAECLARDRGEPLSLNVVRWATRLEFEKVRPNERLPATLRNAASTM